MNCRCLCYFEVTELKVILLSSVAELHVGSEIRLYYVCEFRKVI